MGADGHIKIWDDWSVREVFGDKTNKLFTCLPTAYQHTLGKILYWHCYEASSFFINWDEECDWYSIGQKDDFTIDELRIFVEWLKCNGDWWEVWT